MVSPPSQLSAVIRMNRQLAVDCSVVTPIDIGLEA